MDISLKLREEINFKSKKLIAIKKTLKEEFIGLDSIIDEIIGLVEPWYIFSKYQLKPTIINLWGMTGVGKTSLILRLFELLDIKTTYKFDIGDYNSDDNGYKLKYEISDNIYKTKDEQNFVFIFDEFQLGRTIGQRGDEISQNNLRVLWDLYDTGKIELFNNSTSYRNFYMLLEKLMNCVKNGVKVKNGYVISNIEYFNKELGFFYDEADEMVDHPSQIKVDEPKVDVKSDKRLFIPDTFHWDMYDVWEDRFFNREEVKGHLKTLNETESIKFIDDTIKQAMKLKEFDFKDCLIFNIGNLDGVYKVAKEINPDLDADYLYEFSKDIKVPEIKDELLKYYRPEQLSRLGNNHVIYKPFNKQNYKDLINLQLNNIIKKIKNNFNLRVEFDESVHEILYKEGVYPTQGCRPVISTISTLIEGYVSKIISDIIKNISIDIKKIYWKYNGQKFIIDLFGDDNKKIESNEYNIDLKIDNTKVESNDKQILTAVHETGHIMMSLFKLNLIPNYAVSKTIDHDAGGFCVVNFPDILTSDMLLNRVIYYLGGYIAEYFVFGKERLTSGSSSDIEKATAELNDYYKLYGMDNTPLNFGEVSSNNYLDVIDHKLIHTDYNIKNKVLMLLGIGEKVLMNEVRLFKEITDYLMNNNKIDEDKIKELYKLYSVNKNVEFKDNDNYYDFKETYKQKMKKI